MILKNMFLAVAASLLLSGTSCLAQLPTPGPEHEKLKEMVGTWECEMLVAGAPPSKGTMTFRTALNGMWLESDFKGSFAGLEFLGRGMDSYDAMSKQYVSVWMDSMTGYPTVFRGNFDESGKILTMHAEGPGPTGETVKMKSVSINEDDDHMTFKMYMMDGDQEVETMTMKYTRRK